jgi:hypothetical protein
MIDFHIRRTNMSDDLNVGIPKGPYFPSLARKKNVNTDPIKDLEEWKKKMKPPDYCSIVGCWDVAQTSIHVESNGHEFIIPVCKKCEKQKGEFFIKSDPPPLPVIRKNTKKN